MDKGRYESSDVLEDYGSEHNSSPNKLDSSKQIITFVLNGVEIK